MKLEDIKEVNQTSSHRDVNKMLKEGWIIIRLFNCRTKTQEMESTMPMYVLGKSE